MTGIPSTVLITAGDPHGIGPEIAVKALAGEKGLNLKQCSPMVVGCPQIMKRAARSLKAGIPVKAVSVTEKGIEIVRPAGAAKPDARANRLPFIPVIPPDCPPLDELAPGTCGRRAGRMAYKTLEKAHTLLSQGMADALVTCPISKEALKKAGYKRVAHTEILAHWNGCPDPLTVFNTGKLWIAFFSRHLPLGEAVRRVKKAALVRFTKKLHQELRLIGHKAPRLAMAALNPHAGEGGLLGSEENREIIPAVKALRSAGMDVTGPLPADSVFHFSGRGRFDCVISLYHDQGHIAAKTAGFHRTASLTLGLPYPRTSVDHGTGFDIAWQGSARPDSLIHAVSLAAQLTRKRSGTRKKTYNKSLL